MIKKNLFWSLAVLCIAALSFTACKDSGTSTEEAPAEETMEAPAAEPAEPTDAEMEAPAEGGEEMEGEHPAGHEHPSN
jgi:hypothetical protein